MLSELILIRHATTDMAGVLCGQSDPPLNSAGREQTELLACSLRLSKCRRLYSSDLQRASETAQALSRVWALPIVLCSQLREIHFGDWEGKRWPEVRPVRPELSSPVPPEELCPPGGESFECFRKRVLQALHKIAADCNGTRATVVTHSGVISLALHEFAPGVAAAPIEYCSIHRIEFAAEFIFPHDNPAQSLEYRRK
jgi:broad specificity phosphatase PhoE